MMAFDRTPGNTVLDAATVAEMRAVLSRSLESGNHGSDLKALLTRAAGDARKRGILAEQLLIALKEVWYSIPQLSAQPNNEVQTRLLQELIARSISEYYSS
jgi:hypothetical protein